MQQRNHTRKAVEENRTARSEEKGVHKQKIFTERGLEQLERLRSNNESKSFYHKLNKSRKDFHPRTILCQNKEGTLLSEDDILSRWVEHFDELLNKEIFVSILSVRRVLYVVCFLLGISPTSEV